MATNKNRPSQSLSEIVREQIQLVKTEREIKALLHKINEQINELLVSANCFADQSQQTIGTKRCFTLRVCIFSFQVEELQLKSALISQNPNAENIDATTSFHQNAVDHFDAANIINEQNLNLHATQKRDPYEEDDE